MTDLLPATSPATSTGDRYAIFVDVGYLIAGAGLLVAGTRVRRDLQVDVVKLVGALVERAADEVTGSLVRLYWYDAARDRVPTVEQREIAQLANVKVRLGNLNAAGIQKGVDALLRTDLETLARHGAINDAVLVAGDEDLLAGVEAAQSYGTRVHLWGVEPPYGVNQSERLVWEADTTNSLDAEFCEPYVRLAEGKIAEPKPGDERVATPTAPTPAILAARAAHPDLSAPPPAARQVPPYGPARERMIEIGEHIAHKWLVTRGRDHVADLLPGPWLPSVIDHELLIEAEQELGASLRPHQEAKVWLRDGFWQRVHREFGFSMGTSRSK